MFDPAVGDGLRGVNSDDAAALREFVIMRTLAGTSASRKFLTPKSNRPGTRAGMESPMNWTNTRDGYGLPSVALHWLMVALLVAVCLLMELRGIFPKESAPRSMMQTWHYVLGIAVFALVWLRLVARSFGATPRTTPPPPRWQEALAALTKWTLYALMIGLPLVGWLAVSARGTPVQFFGAELPLLPGRSETLARWLKNVHETAATTGYFVVGLHVLAALYHHYLRHDNTLRLMLPQR